MLNIKTYLNRASVFFVIPMLMAAVLAVGFSGASHACDQLYGECSDQEQGGQWPDANGTTYGETDVKNLGDKQTSQAALKSMISDIIDDAKTVTTANGEALINQRILEYWSDLPDDSNKDAAAIIRAIIDQYQHGAHGKYLRYLIVRYEDSLENPTPQDMINAIIIQRFMQIYNETYPNEGDEEYYN